MPTKKQTTTVKKVKTNKLIPTQVKNQKVEMSTELTMILNETLYEGKAKKNIEKLDTSGIKLLQTSLDLGYNIEVNETYIGIKNEESNLVGRLIPIKKGNRLYTFEKKVKDILDKYSNGEIICLGKPGIGNTDTYIDLSLLTKPKCKRILKTLDPAL